MRHPFLEGAQGVGGAMAESLADTGLILAGLRKLLEGNEGKEDDTRVIVFILWGKESVSEVCV